MKIPPRPSNNDQPRMGVVETENLSRVKKVNLPRVDQVTDAPTDRRIEAQPSRHDWTKKYPGCNFDNLDVKEMLGELGIKVEYVNDSNDPDKWILSRCPWSDAHTTEDGKRDAAVWIRPNSQWPEFHCFHQHCVDKKLEQLLDWAESKQKGIVKKWCIARFLRVYYDKTLSYYIPGEGQNEGKIIRANRQLLENFLIQKGLIEYPQNFSNFSKENKKIAVREALRKEVLRIAVEDNVSYAGALAGYHPGLHTIMNERVLVTEGPQLIMPREGDFPMVRQILFNMFGQGTRDDGLYFDLWLKWSVESLYSGDIHPGMALALVGEKSSGKTLTQTCIITPLFGGRSANALQYALHITPFNDDMNRSEHLIIADQRATTRNAGEILGAFIKEIAGEYVIRMHPKGRAAFSTRPFHRLSLSLNTTEEDLALLPDINDEAVQAKLLVLCAEKHPMPMASITPKEHTQFEEAILAELPCYLYYLFDVLRVPDRLKDERFGIKPYCSPKVRELLEKYSAEGKLLTAINESDLFQAIGGRTLPYWEGGATELLDRLASQRLVARGMNAVELGRLLLGSWETTSRPSGPLCSIFFAMEMLKLGHKGPGILFFERKWLR